MGYKEGRKKKLSDELGFYSEEAAAQATSHWERLHSPVPCRRCLRAWLLRIGCTVVPLIVLTLFLSAERASSLSVRQQPQRQGPAYERPLVLYAYADTDEAYENAHFFLRHGYHTAADWVFIQNGDARDDRFRRLLPLNDSNVRFVQRQNRCFDLGGYGEVLNATDRQLMRNYKNFIFINASLRGPFLPYWAHDLVCWSNEYVRRLNEKVKVVGLSMNCQDLEWKPKRHVQSMLFAVDRVALDILMDEEAGLLACPNGWNEAVAIEVGLSGLLRKKGYQEDVMMMAYHAEDTYAAGEACNANDVLYENDYFGFDMHPLEGMFIKARRGFSPVGRQKYYDWFDKMGYSSEPVCKRIEQANTRHRELIR